MGCIVVVIVRMTELLLLSTTSDIKEWTGLKFAKSQRVVENRGKWRKLLVMKSSVVPQRPSRLRDR